jgi:hypothetical protein
MHPMARRLRTQAKFIGKASTPGLLYDFGAYPAALFASDAKSRVIGDVFALGSHGRLLSELDAYEGSDPLYERMIIEVELAKGGAVEAWAYGLREPPKAKPIASGDFIAHRNMHKPRAVRS